MRCRYERGSLFSDGVVRNLSTLGAFVGARYIDAPGSQGRLTLWYPTSIHPFRLPCKVIHSRRGDDAGFGIEFIGPQEPTVASTIEEYCADFHSSMRAVVVDDDPLVLKMLTRVLSREGVKTIGIDHAPQAAADLEDLAPHVLILDVQMPGLSGIELADLLRAHDPTRDIPIVFYTAAPGSLPAHLAQEPCIKKGQPISDLVRTVVEQLPPETPTD